MEPQKWSPEERLRKLMTIAYQEARKKILNDFRNVNLTMEFEDGSFLPNKQTLCMRFVFDYDPEDIG